VTPVAADAALPPVDVLYERYGAMVLRRVRRFFRPPEDEEAAQEVFELVIRSGHTFQGRCAVPTWLYQVATRHCLVRLRDQRRRAELLDAHGPPAWGRPVAAADQEVMAQLSATWRALPPELAEIAVYYHVDGLRQEDIGALLGVTGRTISNRLQQIAALLTAAEESP
jgi:RNA polymerase sigma-70 factor, ECF subfamily